MKKTILYFIAVIALFASCSKVSGPVTPDLTSISLGRDTLTLTVGNSFQLNIKLTPADYNKSLISLKTSDTTVITVSKSGMVTAKKPGVAIITAVNDKQTISVTCLVTVVSKPVIDSLKIGLLLYFPFNNSGVDSSGNGNNGMINEITSVPNRFGTANSAYYFNGSTSYIRVKDNLGLRLNSTNFTINYWVKLDNYSSSYGTTVLSKRGVGNANGWITGVGGVLNASSIVGKVGTITYNVSGGTDPFAYGQIIVGINSWHMLTAVYNYSKTSVDLYVDGVFDRTSNNIPTPNASTNNDLYIGADSQGLNNSSYYEYLTKGCIDDIRIYNRTLSTNEIHKLFKASY